FEKVKRKLKDVEERDKIRNWQPPISGDDIMNALGIKPGKQVGLVKKAIREAILEDEIPNSREEAYHYMLKEGKKMGMDIKNKTLSSCADSEESVTHSDK